MRVKASLAVAATAAIGNSGQSGAFRFCNKEERAMPPKAADRVLDVRDTAKFGLLVGLSAIFIDAVIAHGLFW